MRYQITAFIISIILFASIDALAYEEEDSVPLTISIQADYGNVENASIKLSGKDVKIKSNISNITNVVKRIGFVAYTPFYEQLGFAEDNEDKTFSDITFTFNSTQLKPKVYRRGFFLGEDLTEKFLKSGIDPLPNKNSDSKGMKHRTLPVDNWQGYVAYSWITELSPHSTNVSTIRYRALPQFGRADISSERFNQIVLKHCGKPGEIRKYISGLNSGSEEILFDRYEIPIKLLRTQVVTLDVSQPKNNWLGGLPIVSLACNVSDSTGNKASFSGKIENPENVISVLVISKLPELPKK